jgi:hypothetical protein
MNMQNIDLLKILISKTTNVESIDNSIIIRVYFQLREENLLRINEMWKCSRDKKSYLSYLSNDILNVIEQLILK